MKPKKVAHPRTPKGAGNAQRSIANTTRILVLQSVNDALTASRIQRAENNSFLRDYQISHTFLVGLNEGEQSLDMEEMMYRVEARGLDPEELFSRLDRKISELRVSFMVVHAGFVFCRSPELVLAVLDRLKSRHPTVRFGLQGGYRVPSNAQARVFEQGDEMRNLISQLF